MADSWWSIQPTDTNAWRLDMQMQGSGSSRRILLLSDIHWDNAHCELAMLKETLEEAKADGCPIFSFGDLFCAMQGKWDPRSSQDALRDEHRGGNYLDLLVSTAFDWFRPYAKQLALISPGNHETAILKRHQVDLTQQLVTLLRREGSPAVCGSYWGFVVAQCLLSQRHSDSVKLHYHHGYGGGGEVTRGLIDHSRTRGMYDADVFVSGHIHRRNAEENVMTRVTTRGKIQQQTQLFLRCSAWKDESNSGWHNEKGRAARPIGGWWLELTTVKKDAIRNNTYSVTMRALPT